MAAVALNRTEEIEYPLGDRISLLACYAGLEIEEWSAGVETSFRVLKRLKSSISKGLDLMSVEGVSNMIPSDPSISVMMSWAIEATSGSCPESIEELVRKSSAITERLGRLSGLSGEACSDEAEAKDLTSFCFALSRKAEAFEDALLQFGV